MLSAAVREHLAIVLVGARNPQNIGAAARAMQDFGFQNLRVVNEFAPPFEAAQLEARSAIGAGEVMRSARLFSSLEEAVGDCAIVAGTTAIGGRTLPRSILALKDAVPAMLSVLEEDVSAVGLDGEPGDEVVPVSSGGRVALLFGSEKTGLTNDQLSFCSLLLTIPMFAPEGRHLSMNLGQSVAVCLYEFSRCGFEGSRQIPLRDKEAATVADRERLLMMLLQVMERSGYARRFPANARPEVVRQLVVHLGVTQSEAATWMGFLRQLLRANTEDQ